MRMIPIAVLSATFLLASIGCAKQEKPAVSDTSKATPEVAQTSKIDKSKIEAPADQMPKSDEVAIIDVQGFGRIVLGFFPEKAPKHVKNFIDLAKQGFFDGTTFHRVIPGFMIQGGDPNSKDDDPNNDGMGGPSTRVNAEFTDLKHLPGTLSMARSQDPNSAGSQFFICHKAAAFLNGQYSVFGQVLAGMDVVDKIANAPRGAADNPYAMNCSNRQKIAMKVTIAKWSEVIQ